MRRIGDRGGFAARRGFLPPDAHAWFRDYNALHRNAGTRCIFHRDAHLTLEETLMILVRDVFHVDPEQMKQAKEGLKQHREINKRLGYPTMRVLTDLVAEYYTIVLESEFASLAEYEGAIKRLLADAAWQQSYAPFRKMLRDGKREIYTIVE